MMVNTKHDTTSYENCSCQREIYDGNALYDAYLRAKSGSDWKPQVQRYEMTYLLDLSKMQRELKEHTYVPISSSMNVVRHVPLQANRYGIELPNILYVMKS